MAKYKKRTTSGYGIETPLPDIFPTPIKAQRAPTAADTGYPIGQMWVDQPSDDVYVLTTVTAGAATWAISSTGTSVLDTLTPDTGTSPVVPTAGHTISVLGGDTTTVTGGLNTITINASDSGYPITPFVVGAATTAGYATVQAAIDAANAAGGGMVYVQPGTYTEDLTLYDGITIRGDNIQSIITGVHTPPAAGAVIFIDLYLTSATDIITSAAAGTTRFRFETCTFNCTNGYVVDCANWTGPVDIYNCNVASTADGVVNVATSTVAIEDSFVGAGANALGIAGGTLAIINSRIACPISPTGASAVSITQGSYIGGTVTTAGTTALAIYDSTFSTGANAAITHGSAGALTISNSTITSSANPCITGAGAGAVTLTDVNFLSNSALAATLTRAYVAEEKCTKVTCGDTVYRVNAFSNEFNVIQAYASDDTVSGVSALNAMNADIQVTAGDGNHTPDAFQASIDAVSGANVLAAYAVHGIAIQTDGSTIGSTLTGAVGEITISETDVADLPQVYAFGVKGYYNTDDAAAVPATGEYAGVGSVVEYTTPLNAYGYGFVATRLGAGAGTAARAAFGVAQGTNAIADWLYGLDLYNTATNAGVAYTNSDIRFQNQSTITVDTEGVTFSGDIETRSISATNTRIQAFYANPLGQLSGQAGALMTGATGTVNDLVFQEGMMMQNFMIGAGQTKIIPIMEADGLDIALDLTATEGQEMNFGVLSSNKHAYTIGTSAAFFVEARFKVADVSGCEPLVIGFRKQEANNGTWTAYTDYATIGIVTSQNADLITLSTEVGGGGTTYTNTTDAFTDGQTHTLRVNVDASGNVTYLIDGVAPSATAAYQFTNALVVMPFIHLVHAAVAPGKIHMISFACGYQAWN